MDGGVHGTVAAQHWHPQKLRRTRGQKAGIEAGIESGDRKRGTLKHRRRGLVRLGKTSSIQSRGGIGICVHLFKCNALVRTACACVLELSCATGYVHDSTSKGVPNLKITSRKHVTSSHTDPNRKGSGRCSPLERSMPQQ